MSKGWLAPTTLALLCAGSGWSTRPPAQETNAQDNKLMFAVMVKQIFNRGNLALVGDFMAKDVTNNGAPLGRDGGLVYEYWSWPAQPGLPRPFGLRAGATRQPDASAS